jgi:hypothetical protein
MGPGTDLIYTGIVPASVSTTVIETDGYEPNSGGQQALNQTLASVFVSNWASQDAFDAYVWLQPYTVGMYNPDVADWIVLLVKGATSGPGPSN